MRLSFTLAPAFLLACAFGLSQLPAGAQQAAGQPGATEQPPVFDEAFMTNSENIKGGENVWAGQCRHCHGNAAYPGKAPKLNPALMEPDFIFDRVTYGFQKMPPWKDVFSMEDRMKVVAYIKSKEFSP